MFFTRSLPLLFLTVATTLAAVNPPPSVTASAASCTSVTVNWSAASGNGSSAPAQYEVFRDSANTSIGLVAATVRTFTDTGAGANSTHTYGVRTKASSGTSIISWSASTSTTSLCPGPDAPPSLTATTPSCNQVSLSWATPTQTGSGVTGYRIYRNNVYITQVSGLSYVNSGLAASTSYTYDVSAMDSVGHESAKSRVVANTPSCQPQPPAAGSPGPANMTIQGCANAVNWSGAAGVRYQVERSTDFGISWNPVDVPTTTFGVTNIRVGAVAVYRVAWFTNTAEYKNNHALFSSDVTPPTAISTYDLTEIAPDQIRLDWSASADTQSGLKGYLLYRDNAFLAFTPNGVTTYTDTTGQGSTSTYDIAAMDRAGNVTAKVRPGGCSFSLETGSWTAPACAGGTSVYLTASRNNCSWSVSNPCAWLSVTPGGTGSGWVNISATSNTSGSPRSCTVTIAGLSFTVTQSACVCNYTISTSSSPSAGGSASGGGTVNCGSSVTVSASPSAGYTFAYWTEGGNVVSSSTSYTFAANANRNLVANFSTCNYSISTTASPSAGGSVSGGGSVSCGSSVTVSASVSAGYTFANWTEGGNVVSSSASYAFTANASRNLVANFTTVPCSYTLSPGSSSYGNAGGTGSFIAYTSCSRTATPSAAWITITGGGSGSGNGTVSFSVTANTGAARNGTITISGSGPSQTYTIYQDAGATCSYALTPNNVYYSSATATGSSIVNAGGGCAWTATALDSWITVTGGGSGAGSGTVAYSVNSYPNVSLDRVGRIRVVGGTTTNILVINQDRNLVPVANASVNASAAVGVSVAMNASASTDEDGVIVSHQWNFGDGTTGSGVTTSHAFGAAGTYTVTVTTTDDLGAAASASKTVVVTNVPVSGTWSIGVGGTGSDGGQAVAVDGSGNSIVAGWLTGSADFGGGSLTSAGGMDLVLAKYNSSGTHVWSKRFGTTGDEQVKAVGVDSAGNIYVCGSYVGSANFGGSTFANAGQYDCFVAKYSSTGQHLWSKTFGSTGRDLFTSLVVDSQGNVIVLGSFQSPYPGLSFGGDPLVSYGYVNIVLAKYSATGSHVWSKNFVSGSHNNPYGLAIDKRTNPLNGQPYDALLLTGSFNYSIDFGGGTLTSASMQYEDGFIAKLAADGSYIWAKRQGSTSTDKNTAIAVDANGDVVVGGFFYSQTDLGAGTITGSAADDNIYVAKYSGTSGNYLWARVLDGNVGSYINAIACDSANNVYATGYYYGWVNFGGTTLYSILNSYDAFVAKYNSSGGLASATSYGGTGSDLANWLTLDNTGKPVMTGIFTGLANLGGLSSLLSLGGYDMFLSRLNP